MQRDTGNPRRLRLVERFHGVELVTLNSRRGVLHC